MNPSTFVSEAEAYDLLTRAGLHPPRHGCVDGILPFVPGEPVVLKGLGEEVWHKSELGAVRFMEFDRTHVAHEAAQMRERLEAVGRRWIDGLVCEQIKCARQGHLPVEAFVSLARGEAGWMLLFGFGGLQAEAFAALAPPLRWPLQFMTPEEALGELEHHLLGRIWLGRLRGTTPLTTVARLQQLLTALWNLAGVTDHAGLTLLELNPVALDLDGLPHPLDAVGRRGAPQISRAPAPPDFLAALRAPRRIALAGVSAQPGGVGRTILENLRRYPLSPGDLVLVKPGQEFFLDLPCVADVGALLAEPVDLLIVALPAPAAAETLTKLIAQGGGAEVVALVSGGLGDGADTAGLGAKLQTLLRTARTAGRWTPAVFGPNFLGHWVPATQLDSSFIAVDKLRAPFPDGGPLTLLSQSGAFLLCRRSRQPRLRFGLGLALGNQMDVALCDVLAALAAEDGTGPVAAYVEGFGAGQLEPAAEAIRLLNAQGRTVVIHRAGRTAAGQAAAASHTGAMAGDLDLERALLERAGARFTNTIAEFDAALAWLGSCPQWQTGPVALLTNAGFESVNGSDLFGAAVPAAKLDVVAKAKLRAVLQRHGLAGLVAPRLPLDLTPMAGEGAFLETADLLLEDAAVLVVGLVPFTRRLEAAGAGAANFARAVADLGTKHGKPVAVAVDAGADYEDYRVAFAEAGLAVFTRVEDALLGLRVLGAVADAPVLTAQAIPSVVAEV
ncbi:MAG: acetate--CoA ligase family protein [Opitutae bacterium]|nr:acetate--CoA ligase family protein [Opitutae bacterium]